MVRGAVRGQRTRRPRSRWGARAQTRLGILAVIVAMVAAACGGDGSVFTTSTVPPDTTTTTSPGSLATEFPRGVVEAYVDGCTRDGEPAFCACSIREFQERLTFEEFLALEGTDLGDSDVVREVTRLCLEEVTLAATTTTTTTQPTVTTTTIPLTPEEVIAVSIDDLQAYWSEQLPAVYGVEYEPLAQTIPYFPSSGDLPGCGPEELPPSIYQDNAFYCRPGDYIAWDAEGLMPDLFREFGDFTVALVMAHEWGHAIQRRGGVRGPTIVTELQADCFAGAWTGAVASGDRDVTLSPGDLEEAMAGYLQFRDPPGTSPNDENAHGSGFDRLAAFQEGYFQGPGECATYEDDFPDVVDIPLTQQDVATGGDLPFAETAPLLSESLEAYWALTYPELFGEDWDPVDVTVPYLPSTGQVPACGFGEVDLAEYEDNAFYCPDGDFVAWDDERLFPDLYSSIGDFAIGMILGHEWARAAMFRAGLPIEGRAAELQADCLTGAWTAELVAFDNPTGIVLSAGDLDEGISGFLTFGADPGEGAMDAATPFDRFDAFADGFFGGAASCLQG